MKNKKRINEIALGIKEVYEDPEFQEYYKSVFNEKEGIAIRDSFGRMTYLIRSLTKSFDDRKFTMLKNRYKDLLRKKESGFR